MPRTLHLFAALVLTAAIGLPGHAQDSPSLGDLARQAQKEKANAPAAKKVLTNDDLPSGTGLGSGGLGSRLGSGLGQAGQPTSASKPGATGSPIQELDRMEAVMNQLATIDRATLAKTALGAADTDFPGRSKWEQRLYQAKQVYVSQGHELVEKGRQILASAESLKGSNDPNDPRAKDLTNSLKELVRDGVRADAAFQAVILEGRDLAAQAASH